jgi:hypothetical protein
MYTIVSSSRILKATLCVCGNNAKITPHHHHHIQALQYVFLNICLYTFRRVSCEFAFDKFYVVIIFIIVFIFISRNNTISIYF